MCVLDSSDECEGGCSQMIPAIDAGQYFIGQLGVPVNSKQLF